MESTQANTVGDQFDTTRTVGAIVAERITRAKVLEKYGIDYCCGGGTPLGEACYKAHVDLQEVVEAIIEEDQELPIDIKEDARSLSLTELTHHIENTHHVFIKTTLPRLTMLLGNTLNAHKTNHPELEEVSSTFHALKTEIEAHLTKEEQVLFPIIRKLDVEGNLPSQGCGIEGPIRQMEHEHDNAGDALRTLSRLTNHNTPPADACNTYRALLDGLHELEKDLHIHIHKENNILFPRAIELVKCKTE
jgi:regulator of cell morphogenesis and NO signaling